MKVKKKALHGLIKNQKQKVKMKQVKDDTIEILSDPLNKAVTLLTSKERLVGKKLMYFYHHNAVVLRNTEPEEYSKPTSRIHLMEYLDETVIVRGRVTDIRLQGTNNKNSMLLITDPRLIHTKAKTTYTEDQPFDSHIWIKTSDIHPLGKDKQGVHISAGDEIVFTGTVYGYKGNVGQNKRGYKYGVKDIQVVRSGISWFTPNNDNYKLITDYPRHKEELYSSKITVLENGKTDVKITIRDLPDWYKSGIEEISYLRKLRKEKEQEEN